MPVGGSRASWGIACGSGACAWGFLDGGRDARRRAGREYYGAGADALGGAGWGFAGRAACWFGAIAGMAGRDHGKLGGHGKLRGRGKLGGRVGVLRAMGCGSGEGVGLPEQDELFQAVEDAREDGGDEGVHGVRHPGTGLPGHNGSVEVGDLCAKRGWLN